MADLRKLKDKAAELASRGKVEKAAEVFREILRADPRDVASCQKLADVLRRGGEIAEAVGRYAEVAERFARDGLLIKAIAICKTILELDPGHGHTQRLLADLYGKRAVGEAARTPLRTMMATPAVKPGGPPAAAGKGPVIALGAEAEIERGVSLPLGPPPAPPPARPVAQFDPSELPAELQAAAGTGRRPTAFDLIAAAGVEAVQAGVEDEVQVDVDLVDEEALELLEVEAEPVPTVAAARPDARLPRIPIFSDLGPEAFVALTEGLSVKRLAAGEAVITEGDTGTDFYVVGSGRLSVKRRDEQGDQVVLGHLGEGEFFGEMAMLSGAPRNATVEALEPAEVLVLSAEVLRGLAGRHPHLVDSLRRFYRQRLLANALAVSPLFRPFGRAERRAIMEHFRERPVRPGEVIVREGTPSDGLYVVLEGALDVTVRRQATTVQVGALREGDLFGEMSCLRKTGASATVTVKRGGSLLRLQRTDFDALVMTWPTVLELMAQLSEERGENLDAVLSGSAVFAEDGLVLV